MAMATILTDTAVVMMEAAAVVVEAARKWRSCRQLEATGRGSWRQQKGSLAVRKVQILEAGYSSGHTRPGILLSEV